MIMSVKEILVKIKSFIKRALYFEQYEYNVFRVAYWMFGKFSATFQLQAANLVVNISNRDGDSAYIFKHK
jgi:hypothetical protein